MSIQFHKRITNDFEKLLFLNTELEVYCKYTNKTQIGSEKISLGFTSVFILVLN